MSFQFLIKRVSVCLLFLSLVGAACAQTQVQTQTDKAPSSGGVTSTSQPGDQGSPSSASTKPISKKVYKVHAVLATETQAVISSPMAGYLEKLLIKEGSNFKKDDVLLEFDCEKRLAALNKSTAQLKLAEINFDSYQRLEKLESASRMKVAETEADYKKALAERRITAHDVKNCKITAPFDGQVTDLLVHQHETVQLYQKLFKVLDNDALTVKMLVPSTWLSWLKIGSPFTLMLREGAKAYKGRVLRIVSRIDAVSRSVKLVGEIFNKQADLRSGMSGEAIFEGPSS